MSNNTFALNISRQNAVHSRSLVLFATISTSSIMIAISQVIPVFYNTHPTLMTIITIILFVAMCLLYNSIVWRWTVLHRLKLINYPDLNGVWTGYLTSQRTEHSKLYPIKLVISQTWLWIDIALQAEDTSSLSIATAITQTADGQYQLQYIYIVERLPNDSQDKDIFQGLCILTLRDENSLSGYYEYFHRKSQQSIHGQMYVERNPSGIVTPVGDLHPQE